MSKDFHADGFDEQTALKLDIFRNYIKNWLPVFLSKKTYEHVNIYDFFAGPGRDTEGNQGSPLIIIEEVQNYLMDVSVPKADGVKIKLYFNDDKKPKYQDLKQNVENCQKTSLFSCEVKNKDFKDAFSEKVAELQSNDTANLVILDQCGIKYITAEIFKTLTNCSATDIMFFVSSSIVKRFCTEPAVKNYFPDIGEQQVENTDSTVIHRFICDEYKKMIPREKQYYLAPFSIKKNANIYGLIFGTSHLLGLQKFLEVCWNKDGITGDANYNIDGNFSRSKKSLFAELNVIGKVEKFEKELIDYVVENKGKATNTDIYKFALTNGFLPKHARQYLKKLQVKKILEVIPLESSKRVRVGDHYLTWDKCKNGVPEVYFKIKGSML